MQKLLLHTKKQAMKEYRDETMEIINRLVELNNGSFHASKDDMEILKEAAYWYREVSKTKEL